MIRIDEIYYNVFFQKLKHFEQTGLKWFDPFGSTDLNDLVSIPATIHARHFLFYDQEPLHRHHIENFFKQYTNIYKGEQILVHSEYASEDVEWLCNTYGFQDYHYFFHGWAALDWYRGYNRTFLGTDPLDRNIQHTFLCPNNIIGGERKHRCELFSELGKRNLIKNNLVSFPEYCPWEKVSALQLFEQLNLQLPDVTLPLKFDDKNDYQHESHCIDLWEQGNNSLLQVVTETVYTDNKVHLTEKIFKPIVMQQPFILVGPQNSLNYLKRYGFKTFETVWDESYDIAPASQRITRVGNLLEELEHSNCREWLNEQCAPIVEHNYNWFYNGGFEQVLWDELTAMMEQW